MLSSELNIDSSKKILKNNNLGKKKLSNNNQLIPTDSTEKIIFNQASNFFSSSESRCQNYCCSNPVEFVINIGIIKKVCGFDVTSNLYIKKINSTNKTNWISNEFEMTFEITSDKVITKSFLNYKLLTIKKKYLELNLTNIKDFINILSNSIDSFVFNKLTGQIDYQVNNFSVKNNKKNSNNNLNNGLCLTNRSGFDVFGINYMDNGDCCICWDKTITKTTCSHFICFECASKLNKNNSCPYCRKENIKLVQSNI